MSGGVGVFLERLVNRSETVGIVDVSVESTNVQCNEECVLGYGR